MAREHIPESLPSSWSRAGHFWDTVHAIPYLIEGEGAYAVGSQLHSIQHADLYHTIGLCPSDWPVLVTLHLVEEEEHNQSGPEFDLVWNTSWFSKFHTLGFRSIS